MWRIHPTNFELRSEFARDRINRRSYAALKTARRTRGRVAAHGAALSLSRFQSLERDPERKDPRCSRVGPARGEPLGLEFGDLEHAGPDHAPARAVGAERQPEGLRRAVAEDP